MTLKYTEDISTSSTTPGDYLVERQFTATAITVDSVAFSTTTLTTHTITLTLNVADPDQTTTTGSDLPERHCEGCFKQLMAQTDTGISDGKPLVHQCCSIS